jgi:hypothetical protein
VAGQAILLLGEFQLSGCGRADQHGTDGRKNGDNACHQGFLLNKWSKGR